MTIRSSEHTKTTMEVANRYGVSWSTVMAWRRLKGFPDDAIVKRGGSLLWDTSRIDQWRRTRPGYARAQMLARLESFERASV